MMNIAFLGLGAMGARMAANLLRAELRVTVWNRTAVAAEPLAVLGASTAATPAQAAAGAEIVFSMVRDDAAAHRVWLAPEEGALAAMSPGAVGVECSTLSLGCVTELARRCGARNIELLDAPVAGSRPQAEAAQLVFLAGGEAAALERARPALLAMGSAIHHVGAVGHGMAVKLAVNAMLAAQAAALAELTGLVERLGVDRGRALEALNGTAVASPALKGLAASIVSENFAPLFPIELAAKDCLYGLAAGEGVAAATPLLAATQTIMQTAVAAGFAADHLSAVAKLYR